MKAEAYALADKLDNECEPYVPLDEITFINAAKMLRQQAYMTLLITKRNLNHIVAWI